MEWTGLVRSCRRPTSARRALAAALFAALLPAAVPAAAQERPVPAGRPAAGVGANPATPAPVLPGPPIERIETASALSTELLGAITGVRELPDGRVLVNDGLRRRLLMMDTTLTTVGVVLDSVSDVFNTYGIRAGALLPFRGDSSYFVDPASNAIVVLDEAGRIVRVRSVWSVQDAQFFTNPGFGHAGPDAHGRMVYRMPVRTTVRQRPPAGWRGPWFPPQPDSAFIIAMDLETRRADTLGVLRIPAVDIRPMDMGQGRIAVFPVTNPLPRTDEWAVLSDGRVAFLRGIDYRIDYLHPDGSWSSSPKLPYDWRRLGEEDKLALIDSVQTVQQRQAMISWATQMIVWSNQFARPYPDGFELPEGYTPPPGLPRDWIFPPGLSFPASYAFACGPGEEPPGGAAAAMAMPGGVMIMQAGGPPVMMSGQPPAQAGAVTVAGAAGNAAAPAAPSCARSPYASLPTGGPVQPAPTPRRVMVVDVNGLPDYRPPFVQGAVRADMDGRLWIRPTQQQPIAGGPVYDVVGADGELERRIQLPQGYTLTGFGRGGIVYLTMRDASGLKLARVRLRPTS
jgi:hypothetical protein